MGHWPCARGSHSLPAFEPLRQTYGRMDVDRDRTEGWFTKDPMEIVEMFGGQWQTAPFFAGDAILFGMHFMHASTTNLTNRFRLSCDVRFQPASEPADSRWIGDSGSGHTVHGQAPLRSMQDARSEWGCMRKFGPLAISPSDKETPVPDRRPNILFIMSDDHASHAMSCYGSRINRTPHLDRIAEGGMRFDNCFCTNSICTPSRAAILTGTLQPRQRRDHAVHADGQPAADLPQAAARGGLPDGHLRQVAPGPGAGARADGL